MKRNFKIINKDSKYFPNKLKLLSNPPKELYVIGDEKILNDFSLAIIGSRKCSELGKEFAKEISANLSEQNIIIVSGFARGIDISAHAACVENNKKTIAVLGGGFDNIYPKENEKYLDKIIKNGGAIISEYPPEYTPLPRNFAQRNRIIAALSDGVLLIEAKNKSGSLITIDFAKKLNKKIFVVPGNLNEKIYEGSNKVLCEGAYCIRNVKDILNQYEKFKNINISKNKQLKMVIEKNLENVYMILSEKPKSVDEICEETNESISQVLSKLTLLEMQDAVRKIENQKFIKIKI